MIVILAANFLLFSAYFAGAQLSPILGNVCAMPLLTNVMPTAYMDLDMKTVMTALTDTATPNFAQALTAYTQGGNARDEFGAVRTLQSLSTKEPMTGQVLFDRYRVYYNSLTYADDFNMAAMQGIGSFQKIDVVTRGEAAAHGVLLLNVWMGVVNEIESAISVCVDGQRLPSNQWNDNEEAWVLYSGSNQTFDSSIGYMLFGIANEYCIETNTCEQGSIADANYEGYALFQESSTDTALGLCEELSMVKWEIYTLMTVPLLQGLIIGAYRADPNSGYNGDEAGAWGEAWAFAYSLLPSINYCSPQVASIVRSNLDITLASPMQSGYKAVIAQLQSIYPCLNVTCADIGGIAAINYPQCTDPSISTIAPTSQTAVVAVSPGVGFLIFIIVFVCFVIATCCAFKQGRKYGRLSGQHDGIN